MHKSFDPSHSHITAYNYSENYNNNVEKLVSNMENKIKILPVGGEQSNSIFADIFCIFSKAGNAKFHSLVH